MPLPHVVPAGPSGAGRRRTAVLLTLALMAAVALTVVLPGTAQADVDAGIRTKEVITTSNVNCSADGCRNNRIVFGPAKERATQKYRQEVRKLQATGQWQCSVKESKAVGRDAPYGLSYLAYWYIKADCKLRIRYYVVRTRDLGVNNTPFTEIAATAGTGPGTLRIDVTRSVAVTASATAGLKVQDISAELGFSRTAENSVVVSCSRQLAAGEGPARLVAYPISRVLAYEIRERVLGGGTGNDPVVARGQLTYPIGAYCELGSNTP